MLVRSVVREPVVIRVDRNKSGGFKNEPLRTMILSGAVAVIELNPSQAN